MQDGRHLPGPAQKRSSLAARIAKAVRGPPPMTIGLRAGDIAGSLRDAPLLRSTSNRVEYQVRTARITDIERLASLGDAVRSDHATSARRVAGDLLRQLVHLPQASIVVAEARREVVGGAVLVLRPSVVSGGYVGTVDMLVVDPAHDVDRVTGALLEDLIRSAGNKGCAAVEAATPDDPADLARWERQGFGFAGPLLRRSVAAVGAAARRT